MKLVFHSQSHKSFNFFFALLGWLGHFVYWPGVIPPGRHSGKGGGELRNVTEEQATIGSLYEMVDGS